MWWEDKFVGHDVLSPFDRLRVSMTTVGDVNFFSRQVNFVVTYG
jgi:hypothetical protein